MQAILTSGVTLIEVLISLLMLSLVLLGLDALEVTAFHLNLNAYYASLAEQQLHNMEERLVRLGPQAGVEQQAALWNQENTSLLPQGRGWVSGSYPVYTLVLSWGGSSSELCEASIWEHAGCVREQFEVAP